MTKINLGNKEIEITQVSEYKLLTEYAVYGVEEKVISSRYIGPKQASLWTRLKRSIFSTQDYQFEKEKSYFFDGYYGKEPKYVLDGDWKYDASSFAVKTLLIKTTRNEFIKFHDLSSVKIADGKIRQENPEKSYDVEVLYQKLLSQL